MRIFIGIISLFIFNGLCAQEALYTWKVADSKYISIEYPAEYKINHYGDTKIVMNGFGPLESSADKFKENFGVIIKDLSDKPMTLEEFAKDTREELESAKTNTPKIVKFEEIQTPAGSAYQIEYRMELSGIQFYQYLRVLVNNNLGFSVLFTVENQRKTYHEEIVARMFDSIELKN